MFIGRRKDRSIYGLWTVRQWPDQEELPDEHGDVLMFYVIQEQRNRGWRLLLRRFRKFWQRLI